MDRGHVLVVDAGTSGPRCYVFDDARIVGSSSGRWDFLHEDDASSLARAFDPRSLWQSICKLIAGGVNDAGISPGQIAAVSVTSQRQAVVFLDEAGAEVYAGPNTDLRAVFEGAAMDAEMRGQIHEITGHLPSFLFAPAKLRWFQVNRPKAYGRIATVLTLADWLAWRLTGTLSSEPTLAAEAGLLDVGQRSWCTTLLDSLGVMSKPTPLAKAGAVLGGVTTDASGETGLPAGVPVAVAGADTQCGLLGLGVAHEHQVGIVAGWSAPVQMVTGQPLVSPEGKTWAGCFLDSGKWVLESSAGDAGNSYHWLADTLLGSDGGVFDRMDDLAGSAPVGSDGAIALLGPSRMDMTSLGMKQGGFFFPVPLTFSELGHPQMVRASIEAIAYAIKANLRQIEGLAGVEATDIAVGGGMIRTRTFRQVLTDVLGTEIRFAPTSEVSALGAYLCAGTAVGKFRSLTEAASSVRPRLEHLEPNPVDSAEYQDYYSRWVELSQRLEEMDL